MVYLKYITSIHLPDLKADIVDISDCHVTHIENRLTYRRGLSGSKRRHQHTGCLGADWTRGTRWRRAKLLWKGHWLPILSSQVKLLPLSVQLPLPNTLGLIPLLLNFQLQSLQSLLELCSSVGELRQFHLCRESGSLSRQGKQQDKMKKMREIREGHRFGELCSRELAPISMAQGQGESKEKDEREAEGAGCLSAPGNGPHPAGSPHAAKLGGSTGPTLLLSLVAMQ